MPNFSWVVLSCKKFFKHSGYKTLIKCMIFKYLILFLGCLLTFLMVFWLSWWRFEVFKKIYWSVVDLQFCIFTIQQSDCFIYTHTHILFIFFSIWLILNGVFEVQFKKIYVQFIFHKIYCIYFIESVAHIFIFLTVYF